MSAPTLPRIAFTASATPDAQSGLTALRALYEEVPEGEAEMGWHNSSVHVSAGQPFALDDLLLEIVTGLQEAVRGPENEVAHLKVIGLGENSFAVANLVSSKTKPELSLPSKAKETSADVIVNARVAMDPQVHAAGGIVDLPSRSGETFKSPGGPARFVGADDGPKGPGPSLGEHTREVLKSIGYSEAQVEAALTAKTVA